MEQSVRRTQNGGNDQEEDYEAQFKPSLPLRPFNGLIRGSDLQLGLCTCGIHETFVTGTSLRLPIANKIYLSFAPMGTSSRNPASTGLPSSPTDAATIIPLDSRPRSLRGWRFATNTTLRPISVSGS